MGRRRPAQLPPSPHGECGIGPFFTLDRFATLEWSAEADGQARSAHDRASVGCAERKVS